MRGCALKEKLCQHKLGHDGWVIPDGWIAPAGECDECDKEREQMPIGERLGPHPLHFPGLGCDRCDAGWARLEKAWVAGPRGKNEEFDKPLARILGYVGPDHIDGQDPLPGVDPKDPHTAPIPRLIVTNGGWATPGLLRGNSRWARVRPPTRNPKEAPIPDSNTKSDSERKQTLATTVTNLVAQGRRVESQTDFYAVLVKGQRPNHTFHLIATLVTLGAWGLVWLTLVLLGGEKRETVTVDEYGNVLIQRL